MSKEKSSWRDKLQKFGSFLSGMIMPNIGAFIAWGLLTALFIPSGWIPNEQFAQIGDIMLPYMLPILVAYSAGQKVYANRGAVIGVVSAMGAIAGSDVPMFLGSMIIAPLSAYLLKKLDDILVPKIKPGFEMLVNNFSLGILGMLMSLVAYMLVGPFITGLSSVMQTAVSSLMENQLIPLVSIIAEPAKILFLNNAIDHGIIGPIALEQVAQAGKSFLFFIIQNPGPGLGVLLAYMFFGQKSERQSAPGAIVIHFFGGIHEIYFPYILMNPIILLPTILAGAAGLFTFNLFDAGMVAAASPGSIFAIFALTERGSYLGVIIGITVSALVSFLGSIPIIKMTKQDVSLEEAQGQSASMKNTKENEASETNEIKANNDVVVNDMGILEKNLNKFNFACDAGMGSSAMGASILNNKFEENNIQVKVTNSSIYDVPENVDVLIVQDELLDSAIQNNPEINYYFTVDNFLSSPTYDEITKQLKDN